MSAHCTLGEYDDDGVARCSCSSVTAAGGSCPFAAEARYRAMIVADFPREARAERARANREKARETREEAAGRDLRAAAVGEDVSRPERAAERHDAQEGAQ